MADCADARLADVPFRVTNPERIPAQRYYDEGFFKAEAEHLWPHVWQMACRLEEIPNVGDFVEYTILGQSVIIVRTASGVKAFHNACRHRGVQLASGHGNCKVQGFICPFHGWRWNIDGENTFVFERKLFSEAELVQAEINLVPCRVEFWGGCAFVNFDDDALPLLECIKPMADRLDVRNVDKLRAEWWKSTVLPVNWKLAMEAFMEAYHVMRTHPQLHSVPLTPAAKYGADTTGTSPPVRPSMTSRQIIDNAVHHLELLSEGMGGMCHASDVAVARDIQNIPLPEDPMAATVMWYTRLNDEITSRARARGVPMPDLNAIGKSHPVSPLQFVFPHYFLLPLFGNMSSYRIRPLTAETCLFELWSLTLFPEGEEPEPPRAPVPTAHDSEEFPEIPRQDYSNLPRQQLGLHAKGFEYMRLSKDVEGLISNYQRLIDGFIAGLDRELLGKATQKACDNMDVPIADIGF